MATKLSIIDLVFGVSPTQVISTIALFQITLVNNDKDVTNTLEYAQGYVAIIQKSN